MDATVKADWVKALRSGEYQQGRGFLLNDNYYCCLGVLAAIQGCDIAKAIPDVSSRSLSHPPRGYDAGLSATKSENLANLNDGALEHATKGPRSFAEIADYIEANIPEE